MGSVRYSFCHSLPLPFLPPCFTTGFHENVHCPVYLYFSDWPGGRHDVPRTRHYLAAGRKGWMVAMGMAV